MSVTRDPNHAAPGLSTPREEAGPTKPLTLAQMIWYSVANLGCGVFYSFNNAVLPLFLQQFTHDARLLGLMGSTHSIEGAVIQPIVGAVSDRTRTRLGRRRPYMLLFLPLSALLVALTPAASHLPVGIRLGLVVLSIFLFTVFFNIGYDPYQALMPDITPESQRGRVTGIWSLFGVVGQAGILLLNLPPGVKFGLVAAIMVVTTLFTCAAIGEPQLPQEPGKRLSHAQEMLEALRGLPTLRQAGKGLLVFFLSGVGIGAVLPFLTVFVKTITKCSDHEAELMFLVLMAATAIGVLPFGWLADRLGPKRVLLIGLILIAAASVNGLWITTLPQVAVVLAIAGIGNAAQSAASYPLLTSLVPAEEVGFYTGLQTTALSIAKPVTVVLTGAKINQGDYRVIFAVCAGSVLAAIVVLLLVNTSAAAAEIAARNRAQGREE
jgi:Na+/melibiose symporter-like transporter